MLDATCVVPSAASCTLREISWVAAPCSSMADAIVVEISDIRPMVTPISLMESTDLVGRALDAADLLTDLAGSFRGLFGKRLNLRSHYGKAAARISRTRRLDRGIEGEKIGLPRNGVDQLDNIPDPARGLRQLTDAIVGSLRLLHRLIGDKRRFLHLTADFVDR